MPARETSFTSLAGVPVHYDRLPPDAKYGSKGKSYTFYCTHKLKDQLELCFAELWPLLPDGTPTIILCAGTTGDGDNAHGRGLAFDLDGLWWGEKRLMMDEYPQSRIVYLGINAHLFLHFSQVLSFHYPRHHDHFHVDFNSSYRYRTSSNAQTFFLQSALRYVFGHDLGSTGIENDGVDGIWGPTTKNALGETMRDIGLSGQGGLGKSDVWFAFLRELRKRCFS